MSTCRSCIYVYVHVQCSLKCSIHLLFVLLPFSVHQYTYRCVQDDWIIVDNGIVSPSNVSDVDPPEIEPGDEEKGPITELSVSKNNNKNRYMYVHVYMYTHTVNCCFFVCLQSSNHIKVQI